MRDRGGLHFSQLEALTEWAKRRGWKEEPTKDAYEVLRLRLGKQCAIFHRKSPTKEHLTVWGDSERLAREYVRWCRQREEAMASQPRQAAG